MNVGGGAPDQKNNRKQTINSDAARLNGKKLRNAASAREP